MRNGFHLARIAGIDIHIDWSLAIVFVLITVSLALGLFPVWHPDWGPGVIWLTALIAAVAFFASVLAHEMAHALVGRAQGIEVPRITLFVFGGMAQIEDEPRAWRGELWMAIVGPITSLVIGVVCLLLADAITGSVAVDPSEPAQALAALSPGATLLVWLGQINVILALFNLVPGFPLDGGRVLRALLWGWTGDKRRATRWASQGGQFFAWFLIISGVAMILGVRLPVLGTGPVAGLWIAFIGWFLNNAALVSYRQLLVRETLENVAVTRLMLRRHEPVSPQTSVRSLVEDHVMGSSHRGFIVQDGETFSGLVCLEDIRKVPRADWDTTEVRQIMTRADDLVTVSPETDAADALALLARHGINQLPVVDQDRVVGLVRREDILRWLSLHAGEDIGDDASAIAASLSRPAPSQKRPRRA